MDKLCLLQYTEIAISLVAKHTNPEMFFTASFFLWKCYVHGLGSQKMSDANLHTLGNLQNQAN